MTKQSNFSKKNYSHEHEIYLKNRRKNILKIKIFQIGILLILGAIWEISAYFNWVDPFIVSSPSKIFKMLITLNNSGMLWYHVGITTFESVAGFILGTIVGIAFAIFIWWSDFLSSVIEPYLVVLNALPKVAFGPIIIIWLGTGMRSIIMMALLISVIIATINILSGFKNTNAEKILLMKSFGANKLQILLKLIIPANIQNIVSTLKINVGMSLIGVITGEFLSSSKGIGYLIVYGGQVLKLDLVMAGIFLLGVIASVMYFLVSGIEKIYLKNKH